MEIPARLARHDFGITGIDCRVLDEHRKQQRDVHDQPKHRASSFASSATNAEMAATEKPRALASVELFGRIAEQVARDRRELRSCAVR
jgi:hypothetical protein